ncbi:putative transcription factor GRF family [Medicago truncatula]|uniref:Putative transcription factor GRF family n=1 Tax=Medicago truncatula TaxID=3880 RepID=A0A396JFH4_MEDTR|nr:putative transcription factor GRF family [Medicago truncatula]
MSGGRMGKNNYNSQSSSSSSMYNDEVRELQCWCPRICVVRKANTVNNLGRPFYVCPLPKVCLTMDDSENCKFFMWVDEAEELGYFENNGVGRSSN